MYKYSTVYIQYIYTHKTTILIVEVTYEHQLPQNFAGFIV